jgi:polyisoprenoid-binding protein YceI
MIRHALLLGLAVCATPSWAAPESYTIDSRHTYPRWAVSHHGFSIYRGQFNRTSGKLVLDWAAKTGSIEVDVDTASINTGDAAFDKDLRGASWFDTERHPKMTYRATTVRFEKDVPVEATGELTFLGVTRPLTLTIAGAKCGTHPVSKKALCGAEVTGSLRRSEFGMKASLPSIGDEVRLTIEIEAFRD